MKLGRRAGTAIPAFALLLLVSGLLGTSIGSVNVPILRTAQIILYKVGLVAKGGWPQSNEAIIFFVRLPRVLVAAEVGMALGLSGAVMQGIFRNPMADPGIVGVSGGASLGAVAAIYTGLAAHYLFATPLCAFGGALIASLLIYVVATDHGKTPVATLLLAGVAASAFFGAITSTVLSLGNDYQMRQIVFWMMGGLSGRGWDHLRMSAPLVLLGSAALMFFARDLNVLLLGDEGARAVGVDSERTRRLLLAVASLITGAAVSISGTIGFVGLVVPHIIRLIVGPDHRVLLPASALGGASFLILADLVARTVVRPVELMVGTVTAFVGAPYFIYLLRRARGERRLY